MAQQQEYRDLDVGDVLQVQMAVESEPSVRGADRSSHSTGTLATEALARLDLPRVTIDVDGSVIRTGATVGWAFRGFNSNHRKDPSYYPLLAYVAQTGHILRLKNRPGNVHDSKQAVPFLREVIDDLRRQLGRRVALEFRMDAASSRAGFSSCSPRGSVATRSRSGTGAGCHSRRSRPPAPGGTRSPRASPGTRRTWSSPSGTTCGSAWSSIGSTSPTRRAGTSS
jgi:hypothetical protein